MYPSCPSEPSLDPNMINNNIQVVQTCPSCPGKSHLDPNMITGLVWAAGVCLSCLGEPLLDPNMITGSIRATRMCSRCPGNPPLILTWSLVQLKLCRHAQATWVNHPLILTRSLVQSELNGCARAVHANYLLILTQSLIRSRCMDVPELPWWITPRTITDSVRAVQTCPNHSGKSPVNLNMIIDLVGYAWMSPRHTNESNLTPNRPLHLHHYHYFKTIKSSATHARSTTTIIHHIKIQNKIIS